jgi:NADH-quinone oxidoreductase subunit C
MSALTLEAVASRFSEKFAAAAPKRVDFRGETTLTVPLTEIRTALAWCRDELGFDYLLDISSVDNFGEEPRFEMVYELYSLSTHLHLRLKCTVSEDEAEKVPTVSDLWPTANWHEREIYDMMGLKFEGHPDLRRILMWEGYPFFPLRKDFPLEGKASEMPDVAFTGIAPLAGGPFVTSPSSATADRREPRAKDFEDRG